MGVRRCAACPWRRTSRCALRARVRGALGARSVRPRDAGLRAASPSRQLGSHASAPMRAHGAPARTRATRRSAIDPTTLAAYHHPSRATPRVGWETTRAPFGQQAWGIGTACSRGYTCGRVCSRQSVVTARHPLSCVVATHQRMRPRVGAPRARACACVWQRDALVCSRGQALARSHTRTWPAACWRDGPRLRYSEGARSAVRVDNMSARGAHVHACSRPWPRATSRTLNRTSSRGRV